MKGISNQVHDLARFFISRPKLLMFLPSLWKWTEWMMKKIKIIWETSKTKIRSYLILSLQDYCPIMLQRWAKYGILVSIKLVLVILIESISFMWALLAFLNRVLFQKILLENCFLQVTMVILWDYSDYHNLRLLYLQYLGSWPSLLYCSQLALWMNRLLNGHYPTDSVWFTEPTFLLMLLSTFLPFQLFSLIQQGK